MRKLNRQVVLIAFVNLTYILFFLHLFFTPSSHTTKPRTKRFGCATKHVWTRPGSSEEIDLRHNQNLRFYTIIVIVLQILETMITQTSDAWLDIFGLNKAHEAKWYLFLFSPSMIWKLEKKNERKTEWRHFGRLGGKNWTFISVLYIMKAGKL